MGAMVPRLLPGGTPSCFQMSLNSNQSVTIVLRVYMVMMEVHSIMCIIYYCFYSNEIWAKDDFNCYQRINIQMFLVMENSTPLFFAV